MSKEFDRIIIPIDGSEYSKRAAYKAITIAKNTDVEVYAIHIIHHNLLLIHPELFQTVEKRFIEDAKEFLQEIDTMGKKSGIRIQKKIIQGIPYEEIIKFADKKNLIVIGNKGKTGLDKVFIGGVAEKVIRYAPCDVLIVKTD